MRKLNTKLNASTTRHSQTYSLTDRVNETMQLVLRCYTAEFRFDWESHLSMVEFYYKCVVNEACKHYLFEVSNGF